MKLWIDDLREDPDTKWAGISEPQGWKWARSSDEAILHLLAHASSPIEEVSFDHDLGGEDTTRSVLLWMIENDVWPDHIYVHSANPVGRKWLLGTAERYAPETTQVHVY